MTQPSSPPRRGGRQARAVPVPIRPASASREPGPSAAAPNKAGSAPDRILAAAETLFAARGFDISLREITSLAQANVAAVNYHFGSKTQMEEVLFERLSDRVNTRRLKDLARILAEAKHEGRAPDLDSIILAFIKPYLEPSEGGQLLARLILQHRIEPSDLTRHIIKVHFDPMAQSFIKAFCLALPSVDPAAFPWRYIFMVGTVVLTITDSGPGNRLDRLSDGAADSRRTEDMREALLLFLRGGLSAAARR